MRQGETDNQNMMSKDDRTEKPFLNEQKRESLNRDDSTGAPVHGDHIKADTSRKQKINLKTRRIIDDDQQNNVHIRPPGHFTGSRVERLFYEKLTKNLDEKYGAKEISAVGGTGAVFSVSDQLLNRTLAMKILLPQFKENEKMVNRFITEARITAFLEHPNIVPIHDVGFAPDMGIYFTMKLVRGETLARILDKLKGRDTEYEKTYNTYRLLNIFRKVCDAVAFAHSNHILHLDIKPENIFVGRFGEVFLMDWGLAALFGDYMKLPDKMKSCFLENISSSLKRPPGVIEGTLPFISPEQAMGNHEQFDPRTDVFLLGAALYNIFTLEAPYEGQFVYEVLEKAITADFPHPNKRNPGRMIPEEICRIINRATQCRREDRYGTAEDLAEDIDDVIAGKWTQHLTKKFRKGEKIIEENSLGTEAYFILKGKALVTKDHESGKAVLRTCGEGEIIGEMSLISNKPRSATVEAVEDTEAAVLTKEIFTQNLKRLPPYIENILRMLTHRLQTVNKIITSGSERSEDMNDI